jgi:hypothetical protein
VGGARSTHPPAAAAVIAGAYGTGTARRTFCCLRHPYRVMPPRFVPREHGGGEQWQQRGGRMQYRRGGPASCGDQRRRVADRDRHRRWARATLYKDLSDVESILVAWHERQIEAHLDRLTDVRDSAGSPGNRLRAVLEAYAELSRERDADELAALLHRGVSGGVRVAWKVMVTDELGNGHPRGLYITQPRALNLALLRVRGLERGEPGWLGRRRWSASAMRRMPREESVRALLLRRTMAPRVAGPSPTCGATLSRHPRPRRARTPRSRVVRFRFGKWQIPGTTAIHWTAGACTRLHIVIGQTRKRGGIG